MRLIIINCTPRAVKASNTEKITGKFRDGFEAAGNTTDTYYLSKRDTWNEIRKAFYDNSSIMFALPLFVECVPGIMLEFLESLEPKEYSNGEGKTDISFLLQGGFAEASQLRCCEQYLEKLPSYFNCSYNGTLIKGNMFMVSMMDGGSREKMISPFVDMGKLFASKGRFDKQEVSEFAKPEYFSKGFIAFFTIVSPLQKMFIRMAAKKLGCRESLKAKPYEKFVL